MIRLRTKQGDHEIFLPDGAEEGFNIDIKHGTKVFLRQVGEFLYDTLNKRTYVGTLFTGWTPADITTLAWYDASDTGTITESAGSVSQIDDKSGNARHLTQVTASLQPKTGTRTLNALNVLDFDGSDHMIHSSFPVPASGDLSVIAVVEIDAVTNDSDSVFSMDSGGLDDWQFESASLSQFDGAINVDGLGGDLGLAGGPYSGVHIVEAFFDKTGANAQGGRFDGNSNNTASLGSSKLATPQDFHLMANRALSRRLNGAIGEVIILEDQTLATRQDVEGYLAWKWSGAL